jgi:cell division protein FtsB
VFAFTAYAAFALLNMQTEITARRLELETKQRQNEAQRIANKDLAGGVEDSVSDEIIERLARERLDYAYPDEKIFIDISGS